MDGAMRHVRLRWTMAASFPTSRSSTVFMSSVPWSSMPVDPSALIDKKAHLIQASALQEQIAEIMQSDWAGYSGNNIKKAELVPGTW